MLLLTTSALGCFCGCTQSALPVSSSPMRPPSSLVDNANATSIVAGSQTGVPVVAATAPEHAANNIMQVGYRDTNKSNAWKTNAKPRAWKHIVMHHTAADRGSVESIHEAHLQRRDSAGNPWLGIGYHFVIGNGKGMGDGQIEPTFRWKQQLHGAHAGNATYNQAGIGICLVGNFEEYPPTTKQMASAKRLVKQLKDAYGIHADNVVGHGDVKKTACPGRFFKVNKVTQGSSNLFGQFQSQEHAGVTIASQELNAR